MPFSITETALPGVLIIEPSVLIDPRGSFMEIYKKSEFAAAGLVVDFVQENLSRSVGGTVRGLHSQRPPKAQVKLTRVIAGEVFDVAADVHPDSPTYGQWVAVRLSSDNRKSLFIPAGYVHGFCVCSAEAEVLYQVSEEYAPELEWGVRFDDPVLAIPWPVSAPRLSERDRRWPLLSPRDSNGQAVTPTLR
jgi:dTDP-4-dehydrorhamnose 3,5-epimerase